MQSFICTSAVCVALTLVGCAVAPYEAQTAVRFRFPSVQIVGAHARELTVDDVRQIIGLAGNRTDIRKPIGQIDTDDLEKVHVISGNAWEIGGSFTTFNVQKKNTRWRIIPSSVHNARAEIVTS